MYIYSTTTATEKAIKHRHTMHQSRTGAKVRHRLGAKARRGAKRRANKVRPTLMKILVTLRKRDKN
uniref:50S ribosomal protein L35 n=1 Tax=Romanomermis culicivorax TaxID=13658 RepID=A0A915KGV5_ROMCU